MQLVLCTPYFTHVHIDIDYIAADSVVSVTRRSSGVGVAPRACVRVYARVLVPPNLYIHTYIQIDS